MNLTKRTILLIAIDFIAFLCSGVAAMFMIRTTTPINGYLYLSTLIGGVLNVIGMAVFGSYRIIWRYATIKEFINCFMGIISGTVISVIYAVSAGFFEDIFFYLLC